MLPPAQLTKTTFTHVDMVKPPAEYTAARAKPITLPEISATSAATASIKNGKTSKGHIGGRFLFFRLIRPLSGGCSGLSLDSRLVDRAAFGWR